jgi:hypothetical protein
VIFVSDSSSNFDCGLLVLPVVDELISSIS